MKMRFSSPEADAVFGRLRPKPSGVCTSETSVFLHEMPTLDLSVIVPCYNAAATLPALLDALAAQRTRFRWEAVLVDDGSTDGTPALLRECAQVNPQWQIISKENGGAASARNAGIRVSRGRYLMFVDADDTVTDGYIEGLMTAAPGAQLAACAYESRTPGGRLLRRAVPQGDADWRIVNGCPWGKAFDRALFAHVLFPEGYWFEDTVLAFLVYPQVTRLATTAACTYLYCSSPNNTTQRAMGDPRSVDTVYVTELALSHAPQDWLTSDAGYAQVLDQFYLNHRRLMGQPRACREQLFALQAGYVNENYPGRAVGACASPGYAAALRRGSFTLGELAVRADKPIKLLARVRQLCHGGR